MFIGKKCLHKMLTLRGLHKKQKDYTKNVYTKNVDTKTVYTKNVDTKTVYTKNLGTKNCLHFKKIFLHKNVDTKNCLH